MAFSPHFDLEALVPKVLGVVLKVLEVMTLIGGLKRWDEGRKN